MGGNNTGIEVPPEVLSGLGSSKRPEVRVTLNSSYVFETTTRAGAVRDAV